MLDLKTQRKIKSKSGDLVKNAEKLVDETKIFNKLKEHQLGNIINIATTTHTVLVVTNFIKYQIGRHPEWRHGEFGKRLIEKLESLEAVAKEIAGNTPMVNEVWINLVRLYLGYLNRYFIYKQKTQESEQKGG
jgi:hypothetical protein